MWFSLSCKFSKNSSNIYPAHVFLVIYDIKVYMKSTLIRFFSFFSDSKASDSSGEDDSDDEEQNGNIEVYNPAMFRF